MIATPPLPDDGGRFARTLLTAAAEVEAAEARIKDEILAAARTGDCDRVIDVVTRWKTCPPCEVLAGSRLATCGTVALTQCGRSSSEPDRAR